MGKNRARTVNLKLLIVFPSLLGVGRSDRQAPLERKKYRPPITPKKFFDKNINGLAQEAYIRFLSTHPRKKQH